MQSAELSNSVHQAFSEISSEILTKVHERWKMVLRLIYSGKGTNEVVEEHRGKLNRKILETKDLPTIPDSVKLDGYYSLSEDEDDEDGDDVDEVAIAERLDHKC